MFLANYQGFITWVTKKAEKELNEHCELSIQHARTTILTALHVNM